MSDLISRKDALKAVGIGALSAATVYGRSEAGMAAKREIERAIADLPSAQPEIIFCKDCKHWEQESICEGYCSEIEKGGFDEDHFCSFAERRTDE